MKLVSKKHALCSLHITVLLTRTKTVSLVISSYTQNTSLEDKA